MYAWREIRCEDCPFRKDCDTARYTLPLRKPEGELSFKDQVLMRQRRRAIKGCVRA